VATATHYRGRGGGFGSRALEIASNVRPSFWRCLHRLDLAFELWGDSAWHQDGDCVADITCGLFLVSTRLTFGSVLPKRLRLPMPLRESVFRSEPAVFRSEPAVFRSEPAYVVDEDPTVALSSTFAKEYR